MAKVDKIRRALLRREPDCRICGRAGTVARAVTIAPIVLPEQGGTIERANYQPVCPRHAANSLPIAPALARILLRRVRQREAERGINKGGVRCK